MEKKQRARAIIIKEGKLASMYREFEDRVFYTFPGGGMEGKETEEECVKRELSEEFGIEVRPIKKVYVYENAKGIEHFYLCEWLSGEFGSGQGEEFSADNKNGKYLPKFVDIAVIPTMPLMPPEVAAVFYEDFSKNGECLRDDIKTIIV